jgi:hypothetical protein
MPQVVHFALVRQGAGFASPLKNSGLFKYGAMTSGAAVVANDPSYVVTQVEDLAVRNDILAGGTTYFSARTALDAHLALHPEDTANLQIMPLHEVAA